MNDIYRNCWNPLWNFFSPTMKLKEKTRAGGKLIKKYHDAKTPYQRLIESEHLSEKEKDKLEKQIKKLNPFKLKEELEKKLKWFFKIVEIHKNQLANAG